MKSFRSFGGPAILWILLVIESASRAWAACDINVTSVPVNLDQAGKTYCLTQDITTGSGDFTIKADNVTLDGQGHSVTVTSEISSTARHDNLTIQNLKLSDGGVTDVYQNGAQNLKIVNNVLSGIIIGEATQITIDGNTVYGGLGMSGASHCVVKGTSTTTSCVVGTTRVTDIWSADNLVENNTFQGESPGGNPFIQLANQLRLVFQNNQVELDNSAANILQVHYTVDSTFEGNTIVSNIDSTKSGETYGVMIRDGTTRMTFRNNYVQSTGVNCMLLGGGGNEIYMEGITDMFSEPWGFDNYVEGNQFFLKSSTLSESTLRYDVSNGGDQIINNLFYNAVGYTAAVRLGAEPPISDPTILQNNTVISMAGGPALSFLDGNEQNGRMTLKNNIFYHNASGGTSATGSIPTADSDYNLYFPAASTFLAREPHSLGVNPLFVSVPDSDFHLSQSPKSPAIGAGQGGVDLGYSFSISSPTPTSTPTANPTAEPTPGDSTQPKTSESASNPGGTLVSSSSPLGCSASDGGSGVWFAILLALWGLARLRKPLRRD